MNQIDKKKIGMYVGVGILAVSLGYYGLFANTEKKNNDINNTNITQKNNIEDNKSADIQLSQNTSNNPVNQVSEVTNDKNENSVIEKTEKAPEQVKPVEAKKETNNSEVNKTQQPKQEVFDGLKILKNEITQTAKFYPYQAGSTYMEVIAVKATDGTIRTALNTCQVCFDSGRGYYKQSGDFLICQNCKNRFHIDQVELVKGGCNPVPVLEEDKKDLGDSILISKAFLESQKEYFTKWKR